MKMVATAPSRQPPLSSPRSLLAIVLLLVACLLCFSIQPFQDLAQQTRRLSLRSANQTSVGIPNLTGLNVITLIFDCCDRHDEHPNIEHNCAMVAPTRHRYIVYTDDLSQPYCDVCQCVKFVKRNCPCAELEKGGNCTNKSLCEKLLFVVDVLKKYKEVVLLDADLLILKNYFLDHLEIRSRAHDFLASYGHAGINEPRKFYRNFNTGLFFMRWLPSLNYSKMEDNMYKYHAGHDQGIISDFVQKEYWNWDTLSWKWHCRAMGRREIDTPHDMCYTIHDRVESDALLDGLNQTRLKVRAVKSSAT